MSEEQVRRMIANYLAKEDLRNKIRARLMMVLSGK
jgi:hypothetical protein